MRVALALAVVVLFGLAPHLDAAVPSYPYQFTARLAALQDQRSYGHWQHHAITFRGSSLKRVPGASTYYSSLLRVEPTNDGYTAVAAQESGITPMPMYPPDQPERGFRFSLVTLHFQGSSERTLRVRFADAIDSYRLRYVDGEGLHVEPVDMQAGSMEPIVFGDFKNLTLKDGEFEWQCNVITTSAARNGELLWKNDIGMEGQPKTIESLDKVLRIDTKAGYTILVLKATGDVVFYSPQLPENDDPWTDIYALYEEEVESANRIKQFQAERLAWRQGGPRPAWADDPSLRPKKFQHPDYYPYIRAAALLEDRRAIPMLIDLIGKGFGLQQRAAAIAALEKINGDDTAWNEARHPGIFLGPIDMGRVYPTQNGIAEQNKWRKEFGLDGENVTQNSVGTENAK